MIKQTRNNTKGQSIIELVVGLIALIPVILFVIDLIVVFFAVQVGDDCCRDAARAAASGRPAITSGTNLFAPETASGRAITVVQNMYHSSSEYLNYNGPVILSGGAPVTGYQTFLPSAQPTPAPDTFDTGPVPATSAGLIAPQYPQGGSYQGTYRVTSQITVKLPAALPMLSPTYTVRSRQEFPITFTESNPGGSN